MDQSGVKPWHLWGSEQVVQVAATGSVSTQLARVSFKRPDTWSFLLVASLIQCPVIPAGGPRVMQVFFDLTLGVGRSSTTIQGFRKFQIDFQVGGPAPALPVSFWTTTAPNVEAFDQATGVFATDGNVLDFPTEDIQCQARIVSNLSPITVSVGSYFAPRTHIRPDWFSPEANERFNGERKGR